MNRSKTVLIVDDDAFNRQGLCLYLQAHGFDAIEAGDAQTAYDLAVQARPHVAIVDIVLPLRPGTRFQLGQSAGIQLVVRLKQKQPTMGVVLFSAYEDRGSPVFELILSGVRGIAYQLKGVQPAELLRTIHEVMNGRIVIDPEVTSKKNLSAAAWDRLSHEERRYVDTAVSQFSQLTTREQDVAQLLAASRSVSGVAEALHLAEKSVENYITQIYGKLGLSELPAHLRQNVLLAKAYLLVELYE